MLWRGRNEPRSQVTWGLISPQQWAQGCSYSCLHLGFSSHLPLSPRLSQVSLNCEYISFRTQGDGRHWDLALRTPALQSLEAPAVEGPRPPISPSVGLIPAADKEGSSWASHLPSGSQLVNIYCVTCKMTPRRGRQDSLRAALWGPSIFQTQLSQVQKMSPPAFYTTASPTVISWKLSNSSFAWSAKPKCPDQIFMCRTNK